MASDSEILILHGSNEKGTDNWVLSVAEGLKISVKNIADNDFNVKLQNISNSVSLTDSGILILIISEKFLSGNENLILKALESVDKKKPLFLIFQEPILAEKLPDLIKDKPVYNFFDINPITYSNRYYSLNEDEEVSKLFWAKILDLAFDVASVIKKKHSTKTLQKAIYLAETSPDQFENRDLIRSELIQRGYVIYPDRLLTGTLKELNAQIDSYMEKCDMSVHILGNQYGELITESEYSLLELQYRAAAKRWKESLADTKAKVFQRLIWLKPGLKPTDERHKWFLGSLRIEEKDSSTEIMQTPIEELKSTLRSKISVYDEKITYKPDDNNTLSLYLISEKKDFEKIEPLKKYFSSKGLEVLTIDYSKDSSLLLAQHYEFLKKSSSAIICDFDCNDFWIKSKLKDLLKSPGLGRTQNFKAKALYSSKKDLNSLQTGNSLLILDGSKSIAEATEPFIKKINSNG